MGKRCALQEERVRARENRVRRGKSRTREKGLLGGRARGRGGGPFNAGAGCSRSLISQEKSTGITEVTTPLPRKKIPPSREGDERGRTRLVLRSLVCGCRGPGDTQRRPRPSSLSLYRVLAERASKPASSGGQRSTPFSRSLSGLCETRRLQHTRPRRAKPGPGRGGGRGNWAGDPGFGDGAGETSSRAPEGESRVGSVRRAGWAALGATGGDSAAASGTDRR
ncbi:hypothetical protein F5884DRAFT_333229 [Xylogone sp. PMI_703]|nr:hypothetical protein F5884DRAFT_333229 [Xylogone sp. PMI_703]